MKTSSLKESVAAYVLLITVCLGLAFLYGISTAKAEGAIHIRADGTVDGTNIIQRNGNVYTFGANIDNGYGIIVEKDNIIIDGLGFTLQGAGDGTGLDVTYRTNVSIRNMQIVNFLYGIVLDGSLGCHVCGNELRSRVAGIWLYKSQNTNISQNVISESGDSGIQIDQASGNVVSGNRITNNTIGIWISGAADTVFCANNLTDSTLYGIMFSQAYSSSGNVVYGNNFVNNAQQVVTYGQGSAWDNGTVGNYWSDYAGSDLNHDGIGDAPYVIDADNTDRSPLTAPAAIPEFPSWIILPMLSLIAIFVTVVKKKGQRQFRHRASV